MKGKNENDCIVFPHYNIWGPLTHSNNTHCLLCITMPLLDKGYLQSVHSRPSQPDPVRRVSMWEVPTSVLQVKNRE